MYKKYLEVDDNQCMRVYNGLNVKQNNLATIKNVDEPNDCIEKCRVRNYFFLETEKIQKESFYKISASFESIYNIHHLPV